MLKHVWRVWASGKYAGNSYESIWLSFELFGYGKSPGTHQNHFRVFNTSNSSPILLFVPRNLNPILGGNAKRRAPKNDRDLSCQKLIWSHGVPLYEKSDANCCCVFLLTCWRHSDPQHLQKLIQQITEILPKNRSQN